ncbi:hypothetical protein H6P81_016193 [Aristolochia fimbriata]|uniref:Uncharacterized protein n=1 Tax=Aristolochia fimbriata TaxID=158543 RepID=A0AAV7E821_ARIFI|nr:hypothetical protein H6P81_016193 [Aristolochia fimbriata]
MEVARVGEVRFGGESPLFTEISPSEPSISPFVSLVFFVMIFPALEVARVGEVRGGVGFVGVVVAGDERRAAVEGVVASFIGGGGVFRYAETGRKRRATEPRPREASACRAAVLFPWLPVMRRGVVGFVAGGASIDGVAGEGGTFVDGVAGGPSAPGVAAAAPSLPGVAWRRDAFARMAAPSVTLVGGLRAFDHTVVVEGETIQTLALYMEGDASHMTYCPSGESVFGGHAEKPTSLVDSSRSCEF